MQTPEVLLPLPPPDHSRDVTEVAPAEAPAAGTTPQGDGSVTDADRLRKRYRELGRAQGHVFGEGLPGSKPPDFNLGWTPPGARPAPVSQSTGVPRAPETR